MSAAHTTQHKQQQQQTQQQRTQQTHSRLPSTDDPLQSFIAHLKPQAAAAKLLTQATRTASRLTPQQQINAQATATAAAAMPPHQQQHSESPSLRLLKQQHLHPQPVAAVSASSSSSGGSEVWEEQPRASASRSKRRRADDDADYTEQSASHDAESEVRSEVDDPEDDDDDDGAAPVKKGAKKDANSNISSAEAKRRRRQQQNRDAAATSRNRKKAYLAGLESKVQSLEAENAKMRAQLKAQKAMIESMRASVQSRIHSAPVMQHQAPQPHPVLPKLVQVAAYQRDHARRVAAAAVSAPAPAQQQQQQQDPLSPSDSFSSAPTSPRDQSGFDRTSSAATTQQASPVQRPAPLHLQPTATCLDDELPALSSPAPMILHKQHSAECVPHASTYLFPSESTSTILTQDADSTPHPLSHHPSQFYTDMDASGPYGGVFEQVSHSLFAASSAPASFLSSSSPSPAVPSLSTESQMIDTRVPAVNRIPESQHSVDHQQSSAVGMHDANEQQQTRVKHEHAHNNLFLQQHSHSEFLF